MAKKKTVATAWLSGCSGCHVALLDLGAELLEFLRQMPLAYSPLADAREFPEVHVALVEGAVASEADREQLLRIREKSTYLVALGTCAMFGGIAGLRNLVTGDDALACTFQDGDQIAGGRPPEAGQVPGLLEKVTPLEAVVAVDLAIPGCPPTSAMIAKALESLLKDELPVWPSRNLCVECDRERRDILIPKQQFLSDSVYAPKELQELVGSAFLLPRRPMHAENVYSSFELPEIDPHLCFLEQGVLCMGPATRQGCRARCLNVNVPCRGCFGPAPTALEQGAKMIDALAAILPAGALMLMEDIVGTGYRYSLAMSEYGPRPQSKVRPATPGAGRSRRKGGRHG